MATLLLLSATQSVAANTPAHSGRSGETNHLNSDFVARAFAAVVHGREYQAGIFTLSRWDGDIPYIIHQDVADPQAVALIGMHLRHLGEISGRQFIASAPQAARLEIFLTRQQDWHQLVNERLGAKVADKLHGAVCLANYSTSDGVINKAQVFIPIDQVRMHGKLVSCVVEELTQVMGLPNDSDAVFPSVFNDRSPQDLLTPLDWVLIKLLYSAQLSPGMTANQSAETVKRLLMQWQADGTLDGAARAVRSGELYPLLGRR